MIIPKMAHIQCYKREQTVASHFAIWRIAQEHPNLVLSESFNISPWLLSASGRFRAEVKQGGLNLAKKDPEALQSQGRKLVKESWTKKFVLNPRISSKVSKIQDC